VNHIKKVVKLMEMVAQIIRNVKIFKLNQYVQIELDVYGLNNAVPNLLSVVITLP
jgi:hypothetical protein